MFKKSLFILTTFFAFVPSLAAFAETQSNGMFIGILSLPGQSTPSIGISISTIKRSISVGDLVQAEVIQIRFDGFGNPQNDVIGDVELILSQASPTSLLFSTADSNSTITIDESASAGVAPFSYKVNVNLILNGKAVSSSDYFFTARILNPKYPKNNSAGVLGTLSHCSIVLNRI